MIVVCTYATKRYSYALEACLRRLAAALQGIEATLIFVHDGSDILAFASALAARLMPSVRFDLVEIHCRNDKLKNYEVPAQLLVAKMQEAAFARARSLGAEWCWSVESDILVPPDAFTLSKGILEGFGGYYDVAMVTYPNGDFLGGRGSPDHYILPTVYDDERVVPPALKKKLDGFKPRQGEKAEATARRWGALIQQLEQCPPKGNIWQLTAEFGWRPRGWFSAAYPAIGRGAVLPTDWVGLGCTLLSRKALAAATFDGYDGRGTQDLFLCWKRWHPNGLRACVISHTVASHVTRERAPDGTHDFQRLILQEASHESSGPYAGHLRVKLSPWRVDKKRQSDARPNRPAPQSQPADRLRSARQRKQRGHAA